MDSSKVVPIDRPSMLAPRTAAIIGAVTDELEDTLAEFKSIIDELPDHGLSDREKDAINANADALIAAVRRHLPPQYPEA